MISLYHVLSRRNASNPYRSGFCTNTHPKISIASFENASLLGAICDHKCTDDYLVKIKLAIDAVHGMKIVAK